LLEPAPDFSIIIGNVSTIPEVIIKFLVNKIPVTCFGKCAE